MSTPIERIRALIPLRVCDSILECPKCGALAGPALKHIDDRVARAPDLALLLRLADAVKARRDAEAEMDDSVFWQAASDRLRLAIEQTNAILAELEAQQ